MPEPETVQSSMPQSDVVHLTLEDLRTSVSEGLVDTVEVLLADMQGRLQGKRMAARHFLETALSEGCEVQSYLLATDVEMNAVDGYSLTSWSTGYGNMILRPDTNTFRKVPWHSSSVAVLCDVFDRNGSPLSISPRQILRQQLDALSMRGWNAMIGTELEFQIFSNSYRQAWDDGYRELLPLTEYSADYSMLDTRDTGTLLGDLFRGLRSAAIDVESIVAEAAPGQHEIVLRFGDALEIADSHAFAKFATKHLVAAAGSSATFMAKLDQKAGNACHIHFSLRSDDGQPVFSGEETHGFSPVMRKFLAGQLAFLPELTLLFAPNVNSYKRFVNGSYAPTAVSWGYDNRTCALRVVGSGQSLRFEHRLPGSDINPYLTTAAIIAAGMRGVEEDLDLEEPILGNAYSFDLPHVPSNIRTAMELFRESDVAAKSFGEEMVAHYMQMAEHEIAEFDRMVTDWEKFRGFERL